MLEFLKRLAARVRQRGMNLPPLDDRSGPEWAGVGVPRRKSPGGLAAAVALVEPHDDDAEDASPN